ncbi:histone H3.v1-like [Scomber scombrus]|uniref:histone H3.v1-like n=1 Tax=Scomber scombrus TaxID=13677 RepID=UPI002DDC6C70|nr:histone H3.v1-like [Scomber scombrus]
MTEDEQEQEEEEEEEQEEKEQDEEEQEEEEEEEEEEQQEEPVIGEVMSQVEQEASNQGSAGSSDEGDVTPVILDEDRVKESPGNTADQSVDQSDPSQPKAAGNGLFSISHNSLRVAHKCPQCKKCFIYRSQVSTLA